MSDATPTPSPSLIGRLRGAWSARGGRPADSRQVAVAVALLLCLAPLLTWGGARWRESQVRAEIAALTKAAAPRMKAERARDAARGELAPALARPTVGATLEGLARALPSEARLVRAEQAGDGRLTIDAAAPDPDKLRAALRRVSETRDLRDAGQRAGDAAILVTFEARR